MSRKMHLFCLENRLVPDATPHQLLVTHFSQNWTNSALVTADDDWSAVSSISGFSGSDTIAEGIDPQTLLSPYSTIDLIANQGVNTALAAGGIAEFDGLANPTIALQPDANADAPNLVISLNASGRSNIFMTYRLRDLDDTADNAIQPVALQYRTGNAGNFVNIPAGYVPDATSGPNLANKLSELKVSLPAAINNQPSVQIRFITANAVGNDEWVGIDDLVISCKDIPINTFYSGAQLNSAVAMDNDGDTFVVWESNSQDGSSYGIYGQRFDSTGAKVGGEFQINTTTLAQQRYPAVAMDADGDTVVVWAAYNVDGESYGIVGQRYNPAGQKVGGEFLINTTTTNSQQQPAVALDADGDAIVTWQSYFQDGDHYGVYAQRFDSSGAKVGGEIHISSFTTGPQRHPKVAVDAGGDALIVWESYPQDTGTSGIYGQRINQGGAKVGGEFPINTYTTHHQTRPSVAMDLAGDTIVVWQSTNQDGNVEGVFGQRFSPAGALVGGEFLINTFTSNFQAHASVAMDADGDAVVSWQSNGQDDNNYGIFAQRFNAAGAKVGVEFPINAYTTLHQRYSEVAVDADGDMFVTWTCDSQDNSSTGVFGQWFRSTNPRPRVANIQVNDGSPQRSMVTSLKITFDAPISFVGSKEAAFSLINQKTAAPVTLAAALDGPGTSVTLTFLSGSIDPGNSLSDGRYTLKVIAGQFAGAGLDTNANGLADGSPLDDYTLVGTPANGLFRFFGDANGDGAVAANDFLVFRQYFNGINPIFDYDNDGSVSASDFVQFRLRFNGMI